MSALHSADFAFNEYSVYTFISVGDNLLHVKSLLIYFTQWRNTPLLK